jgi:hypothetical protein
VNPVSPSTSENSAEDDFWADAESPTQTPPSTVDQAAPGSADKTVISLAQCGDSWVLVVDTLSLDYKDLLCYHYGFGSIMHLKREDLKPKEDVDRYVAAILQAKKKR